MAQNAHPNSRMSLGGPRMELEKGFGPRRMSNVRDVQQSRRQTLAAPQDHKSPGAPRLSVVPSNALPRGKDVKVDIKDPLFQKESKKKIMDFLHRSGFVQASPKMLNNPTQQDFYGMLEVIWKTIDPNHRWGDKPEEQIAAIFQQMKCPYTITKGNLKCVGSPHTWPTAVAALRWFVDLLNFCEVVYATQEEAEDEEARFFSDFLSKGYRSFLEGVDNYGELEDELSRKFDEKNRAELDQIHILEEKNEQLRNEIAALRNAPDRVEELVRKKDGLEFDVRKCREKISELREVEHELCVKLEDATSEREMRKRDTEELLIEKGNLEVRLSRQEISAIEVDRMNMEKKKLEEDIEQLEHQKERIDKRNFEDEVAAQRKLTDVEKAIEQCNSACTSIKLIPPSAKYAEGHTYEVRMNHAAESHKDILSIDLKATIQPRVLQLKERFTSKFYKSHERLLELSTKLTRLEEHIADKSDDRANLTAKLRTITAEQADERERWAAKLSKIQNEIQSISEDIRRLNEQTSASLEKSEKAVQNSKLRQSEMERAHLDECERMTHVLLQMIDEMTVHKEHIQRNLAELNEYFAKAAASASASASLDSFPF